MYKQSECPGLRAMPGLWSHAVSAVGAISSGLTMIRQQLLTECEKCGVMIPHAKKRWMVERGEWRGTGPFNGKHAGFHIWAAYSYSPNAAWSNLG